MSAKADILARVRSALGDTAVPEIARTYRAAGSIPTDGIVDRFCETVAEYRATVHRTSDVAATVRAILGEGKRVGVPAGFRDLGLPVIEDHDLSVAELDALDAVVTGSALAIADTGTIVLVSGPDSGRRALTLVPDHHVCIVQATLRRRLGARRDRRARPRRACDLRLRPERHLGHRAGPRRGRARPAQPRRDRRRIGKSPLAGK